MPNKADGGSQNRDLSSGSEPKLRFCQAPLADDSQMFVDSAMALYGRGECGGDRDFVETGSRIDAKARMSR